MEFPCSFPIKAMGLGNDDFDILVVGIVRKHAPDLAEGAVTTRFSRGGKYVAVTVTIMAKCQAQLDAIYTDLSRHERVVMAL
jgi:putative lipoic acid-binding regulatory protein